MDKNPGSKVDKATDKGHGSYSKGVATADKPGVSQAWDDPNYVPDLDELENMNGGGWANEVEPTPREDSSSGGVPGGGAAQVLKGIFNKKRSAAMAFGTLVFGAGLGFSALFSPAMLIVHMKEIMVSKFDTSSWSQNTRSVRLLSSKIDGANRGLCTTKVSAACRFSTLSEKNVKNLKAAGIEIDTATPNTIGGRYKPTTYSFTDSAGKTTKLTASDFSKFTKANPEFRAALKKAYNPLFSQFNGKAWKWVSGKLNIDKSKNKNLSGTDADKQKALNDAAKNGADDADSRTTVPSEPETDDCDAACAEKNRADAQANADEIDSQKPTAGADIRNTLNKGRNNVAELSGKLGNFLKFTGYIDNACSVYGTIRSVNFAAKTVRALQLASYAMIFMKAADEIKAGVADATTIAYLGGVLTAVGRDINSTNERLYGSATDSFGYKYAAFGDTTTSSKSATIASQYLAGGGFTGELINFTNQVIDIIGGPGNAKRTCAALANPWVQFGSLAVGIATITTPGGAAKAVFQIAQGFALEFGMALLPGLLADIIAGTVTDNINGEHSGNAITSGAGAIFSGMNQATGSPVLTVDQAVAYSGYQKSMIAMQAEEDRATLSPFDTSSQYTFLGSFVRSFLPIYGSSASIPGKLMASLALPFKSLLTSASADSEEAVRASYTKCDDIDYNELGLAADPFCNLIYAMPEEYLSIDPVANAQALETAGEIDENGEPAGEFASFVTNCIEREEPMGYTANTADQTADGSNCKVNDSNAKYYIYWMDLQTEAGLSDETFEEESSSSSTSTSASGDIGEIAPGGMTEAQSEAMLKGMYSRERDAGTYGTPTTATLKYQCVTFIKWYLTKYISDAYRGQPAGNGKDVVKNLANGTFGAKIKFPTGSTPQLYAIASFAAGTPGWATAAGSGAIYGHTALVVGISDTEVVFANSGMGSTYTVVKSIAEVSNNPNITYAYTAEQQTRAFPE